MKSKQVRFTFIQWILISIRSICLISALGTNYLLQNFFNMISSLFPFTIWKRYLSCIINLITTRIALLMLGYLFIESENFKYFARDQPKIHLKSGFIGMGTHKNIIDFFYYSYMFNPTFVRLIIVVEKLRLGESQSEIVKQVYYAPLSHSEALQCALENRGFDPIIVRNEKQMKKVKYRKMAMRTLVTECFEELKGAIFILLPGLKIKQHVQIEQLVANDIFQNELKFVRSGVGLKVTFQDRQIYNLQYKSQVYFLLKLMSQVRISKINVNSFSFRSKFQFYFQKRFPISIHKINIPQLHLIKLFPPRQTFYHTQKDQLHLVCGIAGLGGKGIIGKVIKMIILVNKFFLQAYINKENKQSIDHINYHLIY